MNNSEIVLLMFLYVAREKKCFFCLEFSTSSCYLENRVSVKFVAFENYNYDEFSNSFVHFIN
jgi:hypothetical protein